MKKNIQSVKVLAFYQLETKMINILKFFPGKNMYYDNEKKEHSNGMVDVQTYEKV